MDDEVLFIAETVSLICPLSLQRLTSPVTGPSCRHVFDRHAFTRFAEACRRKKTKAACPVCGMEILVSELLPSTRFEQMLRAAPDRRVTLLEIQADGSVVPAVPTAPRRRGQQSRTAATSSTRRTAARTAKIKPEPARGQANHTVTATATSTAAKAETTTPLHDAAAAKERHDGGVKAEAGFPVPPPPPLPPPPPPPPPPPSLLSDTLMRMSELPASAGAKAAARRAQAERQRRERLAFVEARTTQHIAAFAKNPKHKLAIFPPMTRAERRIVHEIADNAGVVSMGVGSDEDNSKVVVVYATASAPTMEEQDALKLGCPPSRGRVLAKWLLSHLEKRKAEAQQKQADASTARMAAATAAAAERAAAAAARDWQRRRRMQSKIETLAPPVALGGANALPTSLGVARAERDRQRRRLLTGRSQLASRASRGAWRTSSTSGTRSRTTATGSSRRVVGRQGVGSRHRASLQRGGSVPLLLTLGGGRKRDRRSVEEVQRDLAKKRMKRKKEAAAAAAAAAFAAAAVKQEQKMVKLEEERGREEEVKREEVLKREVKRE